jgi:hypothetical protein
MPADRRPIKAFMDYQADITAKAEEARLALWAKLNARGRNLTKAVAHAGRLLPKRLAKQAAVIVKAHGLGGNPKLMRRIDMGAINTAHSDIMTFLDAIDVQERRKTRVLNWFGGTVFNLIVIVTCFIVWLTWSGHL